MSKYKYVLFDLDGTVSESVDGIKESLEYAISEIGCERPNLEDYTLYVGPPLIDTFTGLCGLDSETAERGARLYRDYYNKKGKFRNRAYGGVRELAQRLKGDGARLAVCTSKYEEFAKEIIGIIGLEGCFDAACGSNLDGSRKDKKDLIPYAVKALGGDLERDRKDIVMLGDSRFDAYGAKLCGVDFIGVSYGYGSVEEMLGLGAKGIAASPEGLYEYLK